MPQFRVVARTIMCAVLFGFVLSPGPAPAQVMTTTGDFSVGDSGAANFELPILVPPGTAGMVPSLSLGYSSQAGSGLAGQGWSLDGLSVIARCPQVKVRDGVDRAVKFDGTDPLCLDQQRLVLDSGSHQAANALYRTEIDGLSRIKIASVIAGGNGPQTFEVRTKSGLIMTYGGTADSRVPAPGSSKVRTWAVSEIRDTVGNYLTVSYTQNGTTGEYLPNRIDYGGNANVPTAHYASVQFVYSASRPDPIRHYNAGAPAQTTKRLTNIKTFVGASGVTDYQLSYTATSPGTGASRLEKIKQCAGDGITCLPPVTFGWSGTMPGGLTLVTTQSLTTDTPFSANFQIVDVTGDGLPDAVKYNPGTGIIKVYPGQVNPTTHVPSFGTAITTNVSPYNDNYTKDSVMFLADVNRDNKVDIVWWTKQNPAVSTFLGNGAGGFGQRIIGSIWPAEFVDTKSFYMDLNDYNGDGYPDLFLTVVMDCDSQSFPPQGISGGSFLVYGRADSKFGYNDSGQVQQPVTAGFLPCDQDIGSNASRTIAGIRTQQIDEGGPIDKVVVWQTTYKVGSITHYESCLQSYEVAAGTPNPTITSRSSGLTYHYVNGSSALDVCDNADDSTDRARPVFNTADLNGDGRLDLPFMSSRDGSSPYASTLGQFAGTGDWPFARLVNGEIGGSPGARSIVGDLSDASDFIDWSDVDGDGRADLVVNDTPSSGGARTLRVAYNRADLSFPTVATAYTESGFNPATGWFQMVDLDGDGVEEAVAHSSGGGAVKIWKQGQVLPDRLVSVTDGLGATVQISYGSLTDGAAVYTKDTGATWPDMDVTVPIQVVTAVDTDDGKGGTRETAYSYAGLKVRANDRANFLGFRLTRTRELDADSLVTEEHSQVWPFVGMVTLRTTEVPKPGGGRQVVNKVTSALDYTNNCIDTARVVADGLAGLPCIGTTKRFFPYVRVTKEETWELDNTVMPTVTTTNSYDRYGNALTIATETGFPPAAPAFTKSTVNTYDYGAGLVSNWLLGRLLTTEVTSTSPDLAP